MRTILGCTLGLVLCFGVIAYNKKDADKSDAKRLVGKWSPNDWPEGETGVFEFTKDGKLIITISGKEKKEIKIESTYKLVGNKLTTTTKVGDNTRTDTATVTKLTDTDLVIKSEKWKEETLVRIKDE